MALFAEGKLFREAGTGSGGGDKHNKGYFVDESALTTAYPTAEAGDYAIVESTDTVWIWDSDNSEWKDSDQKGQVTSVNGQTGDVVLDLLPSQTGNAGKFLITNGTDASWSDKPLVNTATGTNSLTILGTAIANQDGINIGVGSVGARSSVVIGNNASANRNSVCIGDSATVLGSYGTAVGVSARTNRTIGYEVAIGLGAQTNAQQAIQIGCVNGVLTTNADANTFKVANSNGNFEIMSADGTVPTARLTKVNTTATLAVADWSSSTQTVTVSGVKADSVVFVSPDPTSASDYASAGILCTAQAADSLTFTCTTTPTNAITVNIVCL